MDLHVDDATFEFIDEPDLSHWAMKVTVKGEGFIDRAIPIAAQVGDDNVEAIFIDVDNPGFVGFLPNEPAPGAQLRVGYADHLVDTDIEYQPPNV